MLQLWRVGQSYNREDRISPPQQNTLASPPDFPQLFVHTHRTLTHSHTHTHTHALTLTHAHTHTHTHALTLTHTHRPSSNTHAHTHALTLARTHSLTHTHTHSVGGSLPVVFSYFCEFFSRKTRGPFVIVLAGFWTVGQIFAALMAWIVIGNDNVYDSIHGHVGSVEMVGWRAYVMLCSFPCLSAAVLLMFMPESPSFLYSVSWG